MAQFAVFVDAGFLLAWGADRRVGARAPRSAVACDYHQVVAKLIRYGEAASRCELLRLYWYDGAPSTGPTPDQLLIAEEPDVKLRLGRLRKREQKGVDTLIVLDLTTLARERAITRAFVLSGDEDLREAVLVAQQLGVRVGLLGLTPTSSGQGQRSQDLAREVDHCHDHGPLLEPLFSHVATPAYVAGCAFAAAWVATAPAEALALLSVAKATVNRQIPQPLIAQLMADVQLALAAAPLLGSAPSLEHWQRLEARRGFWDGIS
jgi:uncharacterized LabA/DUF88 family protein